MIETFGLRNNNPGNIRFTGVQWQGMIGKNQGFMVFDTIQAGTRALAKLLFVYVNYLGYKTIDDIINHYAPPSENNAAAYKADVSDITGVGVHDKIPITLAFVSLLIEAIIRHENGPEGWTFYQTERGGLDTINAAISTAGWVF